MSRLAICSGADAVKAFRRVGYEVDTKRAVILFSVILPSAV